MQGEPVQPPPPPPLPPAIWDVPNAQVLYLYIQQIGREGLKPSDYDPEGLYGRSDHYNYARFGIPIAFYFDGIHEDYHQLSDEAHKIDYLKMEKVTRTIFATAWTLANRPTRPKVDGK